MKKQPYNKSWRNRAAVGVYFYVLSNSEHKTHWLNVHDQENYQVIRAWEMARDRLKAEGHNVKYHVLHSFDDPGDFFISLRIEAITRASTFENRYSQDIIDAFLFAGMGLNAFRRQVHMYMQSTAAEAEMRAAEAEAAYAHWRRFREEYRSEEIDRMFSFTQELWDLDE